jgi:23S rRNA pseudouridine2457 synthase
MKVNDHSRLHYILFNKPYGVLSQFEDRSGRKTLKGFGPFPSTVYPAGRLDADSEGLLLLTDDDVVKHRLMEPKFAHERTYLVQVERIPTPGELERLRKGILLEGRKTRPALVRTLDREPDLPDRPVPVRFRKSVPTCWLEVTLREGRNRQVRRMTAAVGHPTLRLVRARIAFMGIEGLRPGQSRPLTSEEVLRLKRELGV